MKGLILPVILTTLIGVGAGAAFGWFMLGANSTETAGSVQPAAKKAAKPSASKHKPDGHGAAPEKVAEENGCLPAEDQETVVELAPLLTNLKDSANHWIRLETALVLAPGGPPVTLAERERLAQDMVSLIRQTSMVEIQGASGLLNLRSDLQELARLRTEGRSREVVIRGLVIE